MLPTLFREALAAEDLEFQVAPALAEITAEAISEIDLQASRVAYLYDGDAGGLRHKKRLLAGGVPEDRTLVLTHDGTPLAIEDLLEESLYKRAVNDELAPKGIAIPDETPLPAHDRSNFVKTWCRRRRDAQGRPHSEPSKRAVAQRVRFAPRTGRP